MPLQQTSGNVTADAYGGGAAAVPNYIEEIFSTYLYTGNGSTQTINNGIDLAGKGGLVWSKVRNIADTHVLEDTVRGAGKMLFSNDTSAQITDSTTITSFNTTGYTIGTDANQLVNASGNTYASWTFRKQPKFFDVVTYTGNGATNRQISHNLGSAPGAVIAKCTNTTSDWWVWHRSFAGTNYNAYLNDTMAAGAYTDFSSNGSGTMSSTSFCVNGSSNINGNTYVAYLFAHNAGGFGLTGTDNVISCGSFTTAADGSASITLGYEPQWVLVKKTNGSEDWTIVDNMRGMPVDGAAGNDRALWPNLPNAEDKHAYFDPSATGFSLPAGGWLSTSSTYIYIAIRRGPMKVPTDGTSVLGLNARSGTGANATVTGGAGVTDLAIIKNRVATTNWVWTPRLAGTGYLSSNATTAETAAGITILQANPWDVMNGVKVGTTSNMTNASGNAFANYLLGRAPGFFDEVCYTGTDSGWNIPHNLGVQPELIISKKRSGTSDWYVVCKKSSTEYYQGLGLNSTSAAWTDYPAASDFTSTTFYSNGFRRPSGSSQDVGANTSGATYVAYLFASCPGVSKVGSYTGNGSSQTINCGFTGGARFVMIKRTDSTGDWWVWDTARGIVAGNDPGLRLNTTGAETVSAIDAVDADSSGFIVNQVTNINTNVNAATYIYLAIA